jgi:hypothetical protein
MSYDDGGGGYNIRVIEWRLRDLQKIYTPEEEEERAAKALLLNGITPLEGITSLNDITGPVAQNFVQLKAASKTKPTVIVNKLKAPFSRPTTPYKRFLPGQPPPLQKEQTKLKAAASPSQSTLQIAAVIPSHNIPDNIMESLNPEKTTLIAKTSCLGCGEKATQILQFTPGYEMRPSANPKILCGYCTCALRHFIWSFP